MTSHADIDRALAALRDGFASGITRPVDARLEQLARLQRGIERDGDLLADALAADLGKPRAESLITELGTLTQELSHIRHNLASWLQPSAFGLGTLLMPASGHIHREPLGTVLVIAPWNYPMQLSLMPVIGAIAAGNTVMLKPSEITPHCSAALARLVAEHMDERWVQVIEGGIDETTHILRQRFDHIVFTGNGTVGRVVARAAAEHLTPTTLELGGKSPVYVDRGMDLKAVAARLTWAKFTNAGQTCVAPDYVMGESAVLTDLADEIQRQITHMYGEDPQTSGQYGRIVSDKQFDRLSGLLDASRDRVVHGGGTDRADRFIEPTLLRLPSASEGALETPIMGEEIFGPLLPLIPVTGVSEAIGIITSGDKPLTAMVFTDDPEVERAFTEQTSSGSLAVNVALAHAGSSLMPFGGVGESGMGTYHGRASIEALTHPKPVVKKPLKPETLSMIFPPYGRRTGLLGRLMGVRLRRR
ncbi:aldehyde dehydrogenase family protein [Helcobacillus massiliensis]|uniref:Aldehyde dehydrogenase n=1 Tax=Helcobacillus massiliensis TaxID=521392 RepID=A0A839QV48_9MICO|nr:aldehyde dehydrogenase (NAD+) [Helcobacillus massiliensis]